MNCSAIWRIFPLMPTGLTGERRLGSASRAASEGPLAVATNLELEE